MSDTLESLYTKIERAVDLESVVGTMKSLAASNIGQYERAVIALADYYKNVELGLVGCFAQAEKPLIDTKIQKVEPIQAVVFGSDQGLVGQFNDLLADFVLETIRHVHGPKIIWAVGERMYTRLTDSGLTVSGYLEVPNSVQAITPLTGQLMAKFEPTLLYIFHNSPTSGALYQPTRQRLLPLDKKWQQELLTLTWPTRQKPEILGNMETTLKVLLREYLFVSLYKACAESLASENRSRLAAMQRAEKNINDMLDELRQSYNRLRQSTIDSELFDVISGFEALRKSREAELGKER